MTETETGQQHSTFPEQESLKQQDDVVELIQLETEMWEPVVYGGEVSWQEECTDKYECVG